MAFDADVIIVGAGPAGSTAARRLARSGVRVKLIERHRFPRNKPCGGGITTRALARFPELASALARIPTHCVSRMCLSAPNGDTTTIASDRPAELLVRRYDFDCLLAEMASEAGADVVEGVTISQARERDDAVDLVDREGRHFRAPLVIAADGVNGVVGRRLGLNPGWQASRLAFDMMEETPREQLQCADPDSLWVSYGHGAADGYAYIFPKRAHVNVGVGCLLSFYREHVRRPPHALQQDLVAELCARGVLRGLSSREHFTPALVPVGGPLASTGAGRAMTVGDAGGFVNAYTAEGIYYAMVSGDLAARAIADAGLGTRAVTRYARLWHREIGAELRDSVLIQRYLFRDPDRINRVVVALNRAPEMGSLIAAYATGAMSYRAARRRILARFPRVLARLVQLRMTPGRDGRQ